MSKISECNICLKNNDDSSINLDCGHTFHYDCICLWFTHNLKKLVNIKIIKKNVLIV